MLAKFSDVLGYAEGNACAIGSFNTPNLECIHAVLSVAERYDVPVIISHAELHEPVAPLDMIGPVMVFAASRAKVPVCVHLDHCETLDYLVRALDMGFTAVMYDGSMLPYHENVANTKRAVSIAHKYGVGVEGERGQMAAREDGSSSYVGGPIYTDPELAKQYVKETGIDALTPSFGTVHGISITEPVLDLALVKRIKDLVKIPLVMHGGSGVSYDDYRIAIQNGIRKINYYSYMAKAAVTAVQSRLATEKVTYFHDLAYSAQLAMEDDVEKVIRVFYNKEAYNGSN